MSLAAEKEMTHLGETRACEDLDRDLVHVLDEKLDAIWRYDQYIDNADGNPGLQAFWRDLKEFDQKTVERMKEFIAQEIQKGCF